MPTRNLLASLIFAFPCAEREPEGPPDPALIESPCRFAAENLGVEGEDYACADLTVAENRRNPTSEAVITLHVIRIYSGRPTEVPTLYLNGGPGQTFDNILPLLTPEVHQAFTTVGDFVVFDQRGTKHADPTLACEAARGAVTPAELIEALADCRDGYIAAGIDLTAWDTESNADDVADLVTTLGLAKVNLLGVSYGSRLGLEIMRRHPNIVQTVVLDSLNPPRFYSRPNSPRGFFDAIENLFTACEADPTCNSAYPGLRAGLAPLVAGLDAQPLELPGLGMELSGGRLMDTLYGLLYNRPTYPYLPALIAAAGTGQFAAVEALLGPLQSSGVPPAARGMNHAIVCNDGIQYMTQTDIDSATAGVPEYIVEHFMNNEIAPRRTICADFPTRPKDRRILAPIVSDARTLLLTGAWDPTTPPSNATEVAETLSHNTLVQLPKTGHATVLTECGMSLMVQFFSDPNAALDKSCVEDYENLAFVTPEG